MGDEEGPVLGSYALDVRDGRVGEVMGWVGRRVRLRPLGGGREWDVPQEHLGEAAPADVLRERVRLLNRDARRRVELG
ncbi:hypothetical protein [Streptomyces griseoluteus]|uniref:hypothetical protein n=1 Tax=Streptomyces griseoluteus TaxID=29306 RepID=UPI00367E724F